MSEPFAEFDQFICREMLVHPAFFTHPCVKRIAIIGEEPVNIAQEAYKHPQIEEIWLVSTQNHTEASQNPRIKHFTGPTQDWLASMQPESLDLIIISDQHKPTTSSAYTAYLHSLHAEGMLIQLSDSLFQIQDLKLLYQSLRDTGFSDIQIIHFPQPNYPTGWRAAIMAVKQGMFRRVREKDIYNKTFPTRYYNYDMHKAALVLPEFMRNEFLA